MNEFDSLLGENRGAVERFVRYRVASPADADDILQETYLVAYRSFTSLRDRASFKPWLIGIARNKCIDHFRRAARSIEQPFDDAALLRAVSGRFAISETNAVRDTLDDLGARDRELLYLYYFRELTQPEIARKLGVPLGTVKSRLFSAKERFRQRYPYPPETKGEGFMKKMPEIMPEYSIIDADFAPFEVRCEELDGWFAVPRLGENTAWASYDYPPRVKTDETQMAVTGRIVVHGIEGIEISAVTTDGGERSERFIMAQLTDTHCRYLGERYIDKEGVSHLLTFLDGDAFLKNWGVGENNCGMETHLAANGEIVRNADGFAVRSDEKDRTDVTGFYTVEIAGGRYETACVANYYEYGAFTEQYIDRCGRTVLWRRYNRDDWKRGSNDGRSWSEILPDNDRLTVNGKTYVHWYDCISDYIIK